MAVSNDYRCSVCLKIYKHPYSLQKHSWEHTEHWSEAAKCASTKHGQVQVLEAASLLVMLSSSHIKILKIEEKVENFILKTELGDVEFESYCTKDRLGWLLKLRCLLNDNSDLFIDAFLL
ncbi:hypothetical protein HDU92_002072 [Lobulomyces angularis]|nr:hypothetical protein HDU92_002072 [Lobulomyces angularis]